MDISDRIIVARPVEAVFDAWATLERHAEWDDVVLERWRLTDGPVDVGARYRSVERWPGTTVEFDVEITAFERPDRLALTWSEPMGGGWDVIFDAVIEGTEVRLHGTVSPSGLLGVVAPLLRPWATRSCGRSLAGFKAWMESTAADTR